MRGESSEQSEGRKECGAGGVSPDDGGEGGACILEGPQFVQGLTVIEIDGGDVIKINHNINDEKAV